MVLGIEISAGKTIVFGEAVHFTSAVTGENGAVSYQWTVDGENANGADQATFDFTPDGVGEYEITCIVTDEEPVEEESEPSTVPVKSVYETMQGALSYLSKIAKAV